MKKRNKKYKKEPYNEGELQPNKDIVVTLPNKDPTMRLSEIKTNFTEYELFTGLLTIVYKMYCTIAISKNSLIPIEWGMMTNMGPMHGITMAK